MRDKEMNDQLLKSISFDLKEWEKQGNTPTETGRTLAILVLIIAGSFALRLLLEGGIFFPALLIWVLMILGFAWWLFRRPGLSWAQEVDHKLGQYHPVDQMAWEELRKSVETDGVTLHNIRRWFYQEVRAAAPPAEQKWKMLQNNHGAQSTTTPEQPVKPDTKEE